MRSILERVIVLIKLSNLYFPDLPPNRLHGINESVQFGSIKYLFFVLLIL